jgi:nucleotide-binding universal stress UspA family protein/RimJ/RimL family protein N-acetyltransferase
MSSTRDTRTPLRPSTRAEQRLRTDSAPPHRERRERRTITLRDGARATLRPIAPDDRALLTASFARLSGQSRYRRFLTTKNELSEAELDYLVDVDHHDHEAIVAVDPATGEGLGVARYIRWPDDAELAEVAVTVADDWQGRGLGRALLDRLTYRARREGVRRFSALVQGENRASIRLLEGLGDAQRQWATGEVELIIELPPRRGMGARLRNALRAAAAGSLVPAHTLAQRVAAGVGASPHPPVRPGHPIRVIVVGTDGSRAGAQALAVALQLTVAMMAELHVVSTDGAAPPQSDAEELLAAARRAASAEEVEAVTHARRGDLSKALIAVATEHHGDLVVVGSTAQNRSSTSFSGSLPDRISHRAPCSVLIVRTDSRHPPPESGDQTQAAGR